VNKPWLCTYHDFIWDKNHTKTSLINTALNHGVGVNSAHRALTDCQLIALIFDRIGEANNLILSDAINKAVKRSQEDLCLVQAIVSYEEKDLAKEIHFGWHSDTRKWIKVLKESDYLHEHESWPFKSEVIAKAKVNEVSDEYLRYYR
jgi:DNA polymerase-3 subunit epsilon